MLNPQNDFVPDFDVEKEWQENFKKEKKMTATTLIPIGMGLIVLRAGLGIGKFAAAAAESIARPPEAADKITGAVNLPLFLLEGVAILAEVFTFLILILG